VTPIIRFPIVRRLFAACSPLVYRLFAACLPLVRRLFAACSPKSALYKPEKIQRLCNVIAALRLMHNHLALS